MPVIKVISRHESGNLVMKEKITGNDGAVHFGVSGSGVDAKFWGAAAENYMLWDESASTHIISDDVFLAFGTSKDVTIEWDTAATPDQLTMLPLADDTIFQIGNGTLSFDLKLFGATASDLVLWDASESNLEVTGDARIDFSGATVLAGNTDGGLIKGGTSSARIIEDTANMKFISFYVDNGATSGDNRLMYLRQYLTGAGGGGEALRAFTTVENVAGGTAHGAHISLNFGTTGSITGLGIPVRSTLHVPNQVQSGGTYAGGQSEIYFDGTSARIAGATKASIHRFLCDGVAGYTNDVPNVFEFVGLNATQLQSNTASAADHILRIDVGGTLYGIMLVAL